MPAKGSRSRTLPRQTLADRLAEEIQNGILSGEQAPGSTLPSEPQIAEQFGVSRSVVRDATRILMARGLVDVRHGSGVYVTPSQSEAFSQALLLALRRAGASVWDVEQFEQMVFPEAAALAAAEASAEEVETLRSSIKAYLELYRAALLDRSENIAEAEADAELSELRRAFHAVLHAVYAATHNHVLQQLAHPILSLRSFREVSDDSQTPEGFVQNESAYLHELLAAIEAGDPDEARARVSELMSLDAEAVEIMRRTPIGEAPVLGPPSRDS